MMLSVFPFHFGDFIALFFFSLSLEEKDTSKRPFPKLFSPLLSISVFESPVFCSTQISLLRNRREFVFFFGRIEGSQTCRQWGMIIPLPSVWKIEARLTLTLSFSRSMISQRAFSCLPFQKGASYTVVVVVLFFTRKRGQSNRTGRAKCVRNDHVHLAWEEGKTTRGKKDAKACWGQGRERALSSSSFGANHYRNPLHQARIERMLLLISSNWRFLLQFFVAPLHWPLNNIYGCIFFLFIFFFNARPQ